MPPSPRGPAHTKPDACRACSLASRGHGFVPPEGPENAPIVWWGEAPGYDEAALGRPFIGAAGSMMERILRRNRIGRGFFRIANILSCVPPQLQLEGMDFQHTAIHHCATHRAKVHAEPHQVYMAAGATPLKTLLNLHGEKRIRVEEFHGTVNWSDEYQRWVVPTFHPSYLQRGAHNLLGIVSFDLQTALDVAYGKFQPQPMDLVIDPDPEWWDAYVEQVVQAALQDPLGVGIACDMETPDKAGGKPENELGPDDASYQIDRWNFATHPDEGVTIPNHPRFRAGIEKLLALRCPHYWWNGSGYDWDRMFAAGYEVDRLSQYDLMLGAHVLQSDVPLGLGFWAPFYSRFGPWKHLSAIRGEEERYACIDGPQTLRVAHGIIGDLLEQGQWRAFQEDCHELLHLVLKPAQQIGVLIDKPALEAFHTDLEVKQRRLLHEIQAAVPDALRPLTGETAKEPKEGVVHTKGRATTLKGALKADAPDPIKQELFALGAVRVSLEVTRTVLVCQTCGQAEVQKRHRCKDEKGRPVKDVVPVVLPEDRLVVRWFWKEPFNPDSPKQMLGYLQHRGHTPGKNKKTKLDSVDRETLARLAKSTGDPFYQANLDYRAVKKVDSTYALPTLRRIEKDPESRLHPIATFRPSTMRLSYVSPNITNVVGDKGGKENLAAGFRRCVVAASGCTLAEFDFSGIEAVETGWYARAPEYVRLARLGIHAYLASHLLNRPADLRWSDADLLAYFADLKKTEGWVYDQAKRTVHGCLGPDHEVLTPTGWVRFDQYQDGTPVAQWDNGTLSFVVPSHVTRLPHQGEYLIGLEGRSLSAQMTTDHRIPYSLHGGPWREVTAATLPKQGNIPAGGVLEGTETLPPDFLRLIVATQADASVGTGGLVFHLVKERKITRLREILGALGVEYSDVACACHPAGRRMRVGAPMADLVCAWLEGKEKRFHLPAFLKLTAACREIVLAELPKWDGHIRRGGGRYVYFTSDREQGTRVQTLAATLGRQALFRVQPPARGRLGTKAMYCVSFNTRQNVAVEALTRTQIPYKGLVYCVTVPSGYFLIRHRDRISATGNTNYGMTPYAMAMMFPHLYKDVKAAERVQAMYFAICPEVPLWQQAVMARAYDVGMLGGAGEVFTTPTADCYKEYLKDPARYSGVAWWPHPFQYAHYFWSVIAYKKIETISHRMRLKKLGIPLVEINGVWFQQKLGEDAKRACALYPQGTASGVLKRSMRALFAHPDHPSYIGDAYFGRTPLRAPIHDSLLLEIPNRLVDRVVECVAREMLRPVQEQPLPAEWGMGTHLAIGVEAKAGKNWKDVSKLEIPTFAEVMGANLTEETYFGVEDTDEEDVMDFRVA